MNTIFTIFCQLALLYSYCAPVWCGEPDTWLLSEATVSCPERNQLWIYTNSVRLVSTGNVYSLRTNANSHNDDAVNILNFKLEEFNSFLVDTIYVVTNDKPQYIIRLRFDQLGELNRLASSVFSTEPEEQFELKSKYKIFKIIEANAARGEIMADHYSLDEGENIYFGVYTGNETSKRRFIIYGGNNNRKFVVFERNQFNIIRGAATNQFVLAIKSPGEFQQFVYYGLILSLENNLHEAFGKEIPTYASSNINVPVALMNFANDKPVIDENDEASD